MKIGYARVSTDEQNLCLQLDALQAAGCEITFRDEGISGASTKRPGLTDAMKALKPGDVLTVWRLDRLGRSLPHLIELLAKIGQAEAGRESGWSACGADAGKARHGAAFGGRGQGQGGSRTHGRRWGGYAAKGDERTRLNGIKGGKAPAARFASGGRARR